MPLHQPRKILGLLISKPEHYFNVAVGENAYIRRVFFGEEPVQALALLENCFAPGGLLLRKVLTRLYFLLIFGSEWGDLILRREPSDLESTFSIEFRLIR